MASFWDNLPPETLDTATKIALYLGLVYVFATAFTTWFVTRRRTKSVRVERKEDGFREAQENMDLPSPVMFKDKEDQLNNLRIEKIGLEASMSYMNTLQSVGDLSDTVHNKLSMHFGTRLHELNVSLSETTHPPDVFSDDPIPAETSVHQEGDIGISTDEIAGIEADLQKQLKDLESEDDFLKPKSKAPEGQISEPPASQPEFTPMATPASSAPPPSKPAVAAPVAPKPQTSDSDKAAIPPPPGKATMPAAPTKPSFEPVAAVEPMKVKSDPQDEQIFAKSTSIAALRMDMLRELARLKKLINEDD